MDKDTSIIITNENNDNDILAMTEAALLDARTALPMEKTKTIPIAELSTLGAGIVSAFPALETFVQTAGAEMSGLYQLVNAGAGDVLKQAKDGSFWGAMKTAEGSSKMAKFVPVGSAKGTSTVAMKANPAMIMISVAMLAIEKEIGNISETCKQIVSFLEIEKESEVEADLITLNDILTKFKYNLDNEHFVSSNHKMVCDLQRTARKNVISYQKSVNETLKNKKVFVINGQVNKSLKSLYRKFKYYRLSLYTFSLASMTEVLLSGNYKEENIQISINEIRKYTDEYREQFTNCSVFLEKISRGSIETNVIKGLGAASGAVGKVMGNVPKIKDGHADEYLVEKGKKIKSTTEKVSKDVVRSFAEVSDPNTAVFLNKMNELIRIFNYTETIYLDKKNIYLVGGV